MKFVRIFTLTDLCLQVIIENLDLLILSNAFPQKHFDFLCRVYSKDIYQKYSSLNTVTEDFMLWFLNYRNKKITLSSVTRKVIRKFKIVGSNITSLNLSATIETEHILISILCCVPHVKDLDLSTTSCTDKLLSSLPKLCPDIVTLKLRECKGITDEGIEYICGTILSLQNLNIKYTNVTFSGIYSILKGIPSLQCLRYYNMADAFFAIHDEVFGTSTTQLDFYKSTQYNLTELVYEYLDLDFSEEPLNVIRMWTIMCPKVKRVLFEFPVSEEVLHLCTRFQNLEELKIDMSYADSITIEDVLAPISLVANNLSTLILTFVGIPIVTLIENFKNLKHLYLANVYFTDFKEEDLQVTETKLDTLVIKSFDLKFPVSTYKAVALLVSVSKNVTKLCFHSYNPFPQDMLNIILDSMKKLILVDFSHCNIKMDSLIPFFEIPSMKIIYIDVMAMFFPCPNFRNHLHFKTALTRDEDTIRDLSWHVVNDSFYDPDSDNDSETEW